jgi:hypothetical protein
VPIPAFRSDRQLPEGKHLVIWSEITERYGIKPRRVEMLHGLRRALQILEDMGCNRIWIDGGFVTASESPKDYDCCYDTNQMDIPSFRSLHPILAFEANNERQKKEFGGEFYAADSMSYLGVTILELFQLSHRVPMNLIPPRTLAERDLVNALMERKKGILELHLRQGWENQ